MFVFQGGEPDLKTAGKMILHDWQRGKIPFFVPPPKPEEESSTEPAGPSVEQDKVIDDDQQAAARKAIQDIITSQQLKEVPVQEELFSETELRGETSEQCPATGS